MLTKEQKLAILSKAIDEGAKININFYEMETKQAASKINEYARMMNTEVYDHSRNETNWYVAYGRELDVTMFHEQKEESEYMEEDVKFEEEVEL